MRLCEASILTLDIESTGLDTEKDRICEVGWARIRYNKSSNCFQASRQGYSQLINPEIPIPAVSSAVHHITDAKVKDAPFIEAWDKKLTADLFIAHNAEFDRAFCERQGIIPEGSRWLCNYRLARHLLPDAPSHKNQVLRYWLGFDEVEGDAHSAGHDAEVTGLIACKMLNEHFPMTPDDIDVDKLIEFVERPVFLTGAMGFGKYAELTFLECNREDSGYLRWMKRQGQRSAVNSNGWDRDTYFTITEILEGRVTP